MVAFLISSTIFLYEQPDRISPVIKGFSIGTRLNVMELIQNPMETWAKVEGGWILCWNGQWYGGLIGA